MPEIKLVSWNIAGGKFLSTAADQRAKVRAEINVGLSRVIDYARSPSFILLQEIVRYGKNSHLFDLIDVPPEYYVKPTIALDTAHQTYPEKWQKFREDGGWDLDDYLGLGSAILWRRDQFHSAIWSSEDATQDPSLQVEEVHLDTGLYTGDRDTEPRVAVVAHFVVFDNIRPIDIFLINLHLTTLVGEREGIPERDDLGSRIREAQIDIVLNGIVSRYNQWRKRKDRSEGFTKRSPVWIIAGDFNCTPESAEVLRINRMNFFDVVPGKGSGTKRSGLDGRAALSVDYVFAGPKYTAFDPVALTDAASNNKVLHEVSGSDHFPLYATLQLTAS